MKKISYLINLTLIGLISMPDQTYAEQVSINIHSFLPYAIDQIYLGEYVFTNTLINEITIPAGQYPIYIRDLRNQKKINTGYFISVLPAKKLNQPIELSLIFMPDQSVINNSNTITRTEADLPYNKFEALALKKFRNLQDQILKRDQIKILIPDIDTDHVTEHERNLSGYSIASATPTSCTGTFKIKEADLLPYFTSNDSDISFKYRQNANLKQVFFYQYQNNQNIPALNRTIKYSSPFKDGIKFNLVMIPKEKLQTDGTNKNLIRYKVNAKLEMQTNTKKYTLLNRPMYFEEYCVFEDNSLLFYKTKLSRLIDEITPDFNWR